MHLKNIFFLKDSKIHVKKNKVPPLEPALTWRVSIPAWVKWFLDTLWAVGVLIDRKLILTAKLGWSFLTSKRT